FRRRRRRRILRWVRLTYRDWRSRR
ncbi:hypothetical protein NJB18091_00270, partial [Mycobacterium marinum]